MQGGGGVSGGIDYSKPIDDSEFVDIEDEIPANVPPEALAAEAVETDAKNSADVAPSPPPEPPSEPGPAEADCPAGNGSPYTDLRMEYNQEAVDAAIAEARSRTARTAKSVLSRRDKIKFIRLPPFWKQQLVGARGTTYDLAWELLSEHWLTGEETIAVSNILAGRVRLVRESKRKALTQLAERGVIQLTQEGQQAPRATLLGLDGPSPKTDEPSPNTDSGVTKN
jgi:hypothetical protein